MFASLLSSDVAQTWQGASSRWWQPKPRICQGNQFVELPLEEIRDVHGLTVLLDSRLYVEAAMCGSSSGPVGQNGCLPNICQLGSASVALKVRVPKVSPSMLDWNFYASPTQSDEHGLSAGCLRFRSAHLCMRIHLYRSLYSHTSVVHLFKSVFVCLFICRHIRRHTDI